LAAGVRWGLEPEFVAASHAADAADLLRRDDVDVMVWARLNDSSGFDRPDQVGLMGLPIDKAPR
jgi:hypothetical protein